MSIGEPPVLIAAAAIANAVHDAVGVRNLRFADYGGEGVERN
jgi:CO/xanthine dehydrogenase Mo-binding subunit